MEQLTTILAEAGTALASAPAEMMNLAGNTGLIAVLVWAVRYLARKWETSQDKLVDLLEKTIARNTDALGNVNEELGWWRRRRESEPEIRMRRKDQHEDKA